MSGKRKIIFVCCAGLALVVALAGTIAFTSYRRARAIVEPLMGSATEATRDPAMSAGQAHR